MALEALDGPPHAHVPQPVGVVLGAREELRGGGGFSEIDTLITHRNPKGGFMVQNCPELKPLTLSPQLWAPGGGEIEGSS